MSGNVDSALSMPSTGLNEETPSGPTHDAQGDSTSTTDSTKAPAPRNHKKHHLYNVVRLIQGRFIDSAAVVRQNRSKAFAEEIVEPNFEMRRGTTTGLPRTPGSSRVISKPPRKSIGNIYKDAPERGKSSAMTFLNLMAIREDVKRKKLMTKWRLYIRLQVLLNRWWREHCLTEVTQTHPFYMQYQMINDLTEAPADSAIDFKASYFKANKQMKMSQEAVRILTLPPYLRTKEEVYYAMIALRAIDSIADYPLRMQKALAQHGLFQSFGPKRVIVKQTHAPCYFYFILYGTVVVATLDPGEPYAKTRVALRRGENFGELAIAHRTARQSTVLTMEYTEFLTIDCDTYENIFMAGGVKTIQDPDHNRFMKALFFLKDIPIEKINNNPKAMEFCYFKRNTVMVKNSNNSDWIYIVKSGSLKVYKKLQRCYPTVNKRTGNYLSRAHTDGYHCFMCQDSEFNRYAVYNNLDLPTPLSPESDSDDDLFHMDKTCDREKENLLSLPLLKRVEKMIRPRTASGVISTFGQSSVKRNLRSAKSDGSKSRRVTPSILVTDKLVDETEHKEEKKTTILTDQLGAGKRTLIDDYEQIEKDDKPMSSVHISNEPSERRPESDKYTAMQQFIHPFVTDTTKKDLTDADLDPEFVLVQILTKGQAFGIQQVFLEDQPGLYLVSAGAECVMLNKKIYKDLVNPNTAQNIKQHLSPYPSDEVLQENLQTRVNWMQYRKITLKSLQQEHKSGSMTKLPTKGRRFAFGKT